MFALLVALRFLAHKLQFLGIDDGFGSRRRRARNGACHAQVLLDVSGNQFLGSILPLVQYFLARGNLQSFKMSVLVIKNSSAVLHKPDHREGD